MNELDVYYRALSKYRSVTTEDRECTLFRRSVAQADQGNDNIKITRNICTVEEDWIDEIEKGLVFIEKAIKEERQFIYSNGEVLEIEKVKNVSTESVRHLAKHSNLITKEQEGEDIIPDKLYSVERLNDYAVYENRFLYMLLCYLRDFITIRYNKILDLSNKYDGTLTIKKEITHAKRKLSYSVDLHEERRDDEYLREHNSAKNVIDRMDLMLKTVMVFLATPLMEIAGKAPMLKPPITKTNVLKMDNNFKGAVALYDYIIAYEKPGYVCEVQTIEIAPFGDQLADEISEATGMLSFLTYSYGFNLTSILKSNYELEESLQREREFQKRREQLEALKRRISNMQEEPNEYILMLEQQIKTLESENRQIIPLKEQIGLLKESENELSNALKLSRQETDELQKELLDIEDKHRVEIDGIKAEYDERIHQNILKNEAEMKELERICSERISQINEQMRRTVEEFNEKISALKGERDAIEQRCNEIADANKLLEEEKLIFESRITSLRALNGQVSNDEYTEKDGFEELEREYEALTRLYQLKWGSAKKKIRKRFLNLEYLKGNKE